MIGIIKGLKDAVFTRFGVDFVAEGVKPETLNRQELGDAVFEKLKERYDAKEKLIGPEAMRHHERMIMLSVIDQQWKDHLLSMDHLKEGIGLRGYGQHDPLVEYKKESFDMFEAMMQRFQEDTVRYLYLMQILERPPDQGRRWTSTGRCGAERSGAGTRCSCRAWWRWQRSSSFSHGFDFCRRTGRSFHAPQAPRTGTGPHGRRRRCAPGAAGRPRAGESGTERSLPVRVREEI